MRIGSWRRCRLESGLQQIAVRRESPMPKVVDHESRRKMVARVAFETMESVGPERASIREIARRGGFSHSLLSHYFRDSDDVFGFAYRYLTESVLERVSARTANLAPGIDRLYAALDESCPYRLGVGAVATLSCWVHAVGNQHNRLMQQRSYGLWRKCLRRYMVESIREKHIAPRVGVADLLDLSIMFLDGLCVAAVFDASRWPPRRQVRLLDRFVEINFNPTRAYARGAGVNRRTSGRKSA
jgi:AcrR family transcriptional regulator